jgi:hypothetical protein
MRGGAAWQVMRHFCRVAQEHGHPVFRRLHELSGQLSHKTAAFLVPGGGGGREGGDGAEGGAGGEEGGGGGGEQQDVLRQMNLVSNLMSAGLQQIMQDLRRPLALHARPGHVLTALWGGVEVIRRRGRGWATRARAGGEGEGEGGRLERGRVARARERVGG